MKLVSSGLGYLCVSIHFYLSLPPFKTTLSMVDVAALPDKGERLRTQVKELEEALGSLSLTAASQPGNSLTVTNKHQCQRLATATVLYKSISEAQVGQNSSDASPANSQVNPFSRQGGTILLPVPPAPGPSQHQASSSSLGLQLSQGYTQMYGGRLKVEIVDVFKLILSCLFFVCLIFTMTLFFHPKCCSVHLFSSIYHSYRHPNSQSLVFPADSQVQAFYGGRMTEDRLLAVKNATCEAIDHLHRSLESCPDAETEAPDPKGIKVNQKIADSQQQIDAHGVGMMRSAVFCNIVIL